MGMSATQARYLSLIAQQSNLEYQGQQINQERTVLSQQVSDLYNSLLALEVPTPPNTKEYSKVVYSGTMGTATYKFEASSVRPGSDGKYTVTLSTTEYGSSLQLNKGYAITKEGPETVKGTSLAKTYKKEEPSGNYAFDTDYQKGDPLPEGATFVSNIGTTKPADLTNIFIAVDEDGDGTPESIEPATDENTTGYTGNYYRLDDGTGTFDPNSSLPVNEIMEEKEYPLELDKADLANLYIIGDDNQLIKVTEDKINDYLIPVGGSSDKYTLKPEYNFFIKADGGDTELPVSPEASNKRTYTIAGKPAKTLEEALDAGIINSTEYNGYINAINNANIKPANGDQAYTAADFYLYEDDNSVIHFALKTDVEDGNGGTVTYDCIANASFAKNEVKEQCNLTFDPSSGRIVTIEVPVKNENGEITSYMSMDLSSSTETDQVAYDDAMAQYEYNQYLYDQEQTEINARTEKIQTMDRNLELKLQRLDTQRQQITTEIDSLKTVLKDNIEGSYKTFSG